MYGLGNIEFYQANAEDLSSVVPVSRFDLVYSFGVIHHTPHPENAVEQVRRYMDDDSTLKAMVYNRRSWKVFWILLKYGKGAFWKLDELVARYSESEPGCPVTYSYNRNSVKRLLRGFEITDAKIDPFSPTASPIMSNTGTTRPGISDAFPLRCFARWNENGDGTYVLRRSGVLDRTQRTRILPTDNHFPVPSKRIAVETGEDPLFQSK